MVGRPDLALVRVEKNSAVGCAARTLRIGRRG